MQDRSEITKNKIGCLDDDTGIIPSTDDVYVENSKTSSADWDSFAAQCGASYKCAFRAHTIVNQPSIFIWHVKRLDIFLWQGEYRKKIGQCAILSGMRLRIFSDQLQLLPEAAGLWCHAMQAVLRTLGPGRYCYGSEWSTERPREEDAAKLVGVTIEQVRRAYLEAVEFSQWADWDTYWRAISANVRRNFQKAIRDDAHLRLTERRSHHLLRYLFVTTLIRRDTLSRKAVGGSSLLRSVKSLVRTVSLLNHTTMTTHHSANGMSAFSTCIDFGAATFYLEGGLRKTGTDGSGWLVLVSTIRRAFERSGGRGLFVMGPVDDETMNKPEWQGLALSRRQCRVTQRQVATITFSYYEVRR